MKGYSPRLTSLIEILKTNVFVDQQDIEIILHQLVNKKMSEDEAYNGLLLLEKNTFSSPINLTSQKIDDEWQALLRVTEESEVRWQKLASYQFLLGLLSLPVTVASIFISIFFNWQGQEGAVIIASVVAGCLTAIVTHSFFVLRIHQQARLAAERLSEKRVGILFLRLAIGRSNPEESLKLLNAGTAMFLGHYAANTYPLQSSDLLAAQGADKKNEDSSK